MGLQVRPIRPLMSLASIPRALRMATLEAELAWKATGSVSVCNSRIRREGHTDWVLVQHASVGASLRAAGVATARMGRTRMTKEATRENILVSIRESSLKLRVLFAEDRGCIDWSYIMLVMNSLPCMLRVCTSTQPAMSCGAEAMDDGRHKGCGVGYSTVSDIWKREYVVDSDVGHAVIAVVWGFARCSLAACLCRSRTL